jgi:hypothetical protein
MGRCVVKHFFFSFLLVFCYFLESFYFSPVSFASNDLRPGISLALEYHVSRLQNFLFSFTTEEECLQHLHYPSALFSLFSVEIGGWSIRETDLKVARYWRCFFWNDFLTSVLDNKVLDRPASLGGSNSGNNFFFLGEDHKFLIKTMRESELSNLLRADNTTPTWLSYVESQKGLTLLPKFLCVFSLTNPSQKIKTHFTIFPNVYYQNIYPTSSPPPLVNVYDIKSSRPPERCWANVSIGYFANYYHRFGPQSYLPTSEGKSSQDLFWSILTKDFEFLQTHNLIMGSSLLLVSHEHSTDTLTHCPKQFHDVFEPKQILFASTIPVKVTEQRTILSNRFAYSHTKCIITYMGIIDVISSPPTSKEKLRLIGHLGQPKYSQHSFFMSCLIGSRFVSHTIDSKCPSKDAWDCDMNKQIAFAHGVAPSSMWS